VHQQAATTLLSQPVLCSSKQQAASLRFDPSLRYFFLPLEASHWVSSFLSHARCKVASNHLSLASQSKSKQQAF
jgi:hypothetical protein